MMMMTTRDDNVRFLRHRTAEPAPNDGPIRIREIGETLLVEFQGQERVAELLRAAADWLDAHPGATALALNVQCLEDPGKPLEPLEHLLEMVIEG